MSQENMASKYLDKANKFAEIGMRQIKLPLKVSGTDVVVLRPKQESKWTNVFGGSYSSDNIVENDFDTGTTRLIINLNEMRDVWARNRDTTEAYTDDGSLKVGDELQYTRNKITYRFKIIQKSAYSEAEAGVYMYVLSSIIETTEMKEDGYGDY